MSTVTELREELDTLAKSHAMSRYLVIKIVDGRYSVIHTAGDLDQAKEVTAKCRKYCGEDAAKLVVNPYNPLNSLRHEQAWHQPENIEADIKKLMV